MRGPAQSKRIVNSGRAVLHQGKKRACILNCPKSAMKNLLMEFIVAPHNIGMLQRKVGKTVTHLVIPMESSITNKRETYQALTPSHILKMGDHVLKQVEGGDKLMFSRNPTLWKHSYIGYEAEEADDHCIGLPQANTTGHNADFDGDEGNLYVAKYVAGRIEIEMTNSRYILFASGNGSPVIGIKYNGIVGAYVLSGDNNISETSFDQLISIIEGRAINDPESSITDLRIERQHYEQRVRQLNEEGRRYGFRQDKKELERIEKETREYPEKKAKRAEEERKKYEKMLEEEKREYDKGAKAREDKEIKLPKILPYEDIPFYSGRTLISMLFPRNLNYRRGEYVYDKDGNLISEPIIIENGFLIKGRLKAVDVDNHLITAIANIERWNAPYLFIDRGYALMSSYISRKGLTISAEDYIMPGKLHSQVVPADFDKELEEINREVQKMEAEKERKTKASIDRIEGNISNEILRVMGNVKKLLAEGEYNQRDIATIAYMSEARGNVDSIATAVSMVGQLFNGSLRVGRDVRRLSYYCEPDSMDITDRGFIRSSYTSGLSPKEVMSIANPARLQSFTTYLGTPQSGNASRQMALHEAGMYVDASGCLVSREQKILDQLNGYGCSSEFVTWRTSAFGDVESPVDALQLLQLVKSRQA
jgi:DNA-directed RNA polymerase beta' subunit